MSIKTATEVVGHGKREMSQRFSLEHSRYFDKDVGDTSFNSLTANTKKAFLSQQESYYSYLSPITLSTPTSTIDLENFPLDFSHNRVPLCLHML